MFSLIVKNQNFSFIRYLAKITKENEDKNIQEHGLLRG